LGIVPPDGLAYSTTPSAGKQVGTYKYAFTFVTADGIESNPQDFDLTLVLTSASYVSFSEIPTSSDARVVARRIYRSLANSTAMFFLYEIPDNTTTTFTDDYPDGRLDLTRPLTWSDGGFPGSGGVYVEDHSIPPTLAVLSTGLHSVAGSTGRSGSGILFGAVGATVYWSALGFPDYWPIVNQFSLAENVESIVSYGGATFVFTPNFIYQARGDSDDAISWNRTSAAFGVRKGYGRFTTPTTQGILFFAQDGLAVFDGSSARLVAENKLPRGYFDSLTINAVGFFRNRFHVFTNNTGDTATLIFDFRDGIGNPIITSSTHLISAAHVANYAEPVTADVLPQLPSSVGSIKVSVPGSYKVVDTGTYAITLSVTAAPSGGTNATAAGLFGVDRIAVRSGGSGYTSVPTVRFTPPAGGGRAPKAVASVAGGKVLAITVTDSGDGYTSAEMASSSTFGPAIITLDGGGGSGATFDLYTKFTGVTMTNAGAGYTTAPVVTASIAAGGTTSLAAQFVADLEPQSYKDAALVRLGSTLYRIGGFMLKSPDPSQTPVQTIDTYNTGTSAWARSSVAYPYTLVGLAAADNGTNTAYIAGGGSDIDTAVSAELYYFNGSAFTLRSPNMPAALAYGSLSLFPFDVVYYIGGVTTGSGFISDKVYKYDPNAVGGAAWSSYSLIAGVTPYWIAYHTAAVVGTKIYIFGGMVSTTSNTLSNASLNSNVLIWDTSNSTLTIDSSGPAVGWTGRQFAQSAVYGGKIYVYGGLGSTDPDSLGNVLSDLWIYDPAGTPGSSTTPTWTQCRTGEVINAQARARAAYAYNSTTGTMYAVGGQTSYSLFASDAVSIPLAQASDCSGTPGLYVMETTGTSVKLFEGGNRMSDWVWQGRREVGTIPGPKMTWMRARAMVNDSVSIGAQFQDGVSTGTWDTYNTTAAGTTGLGSQVRFWFPSRANGANNPVPIGQWIGLRLKANSSTTAQVYRVEIDAKMDTDGG